MKKRTLVAALFAAVSLGAAAHGGSMHTQRPAGDGPKEQKDWGIAGDAKRATRTVTVTMDDTMRFTPDRIEVKQGETIRFTVTNAGKALHEFVIGTKRELDEHAALMLRFPNMEHEEPWMAHVPPGASGELAWTFNRPGEFEFACLVAGHYQAGMKGRITVKGKQS